MKIFNFFKSNIEKPKFDISNYKFTSDSHARYENGIKTGNVDDCWRGIYVKSNPTITNTFLVTIYNIDDANWGENVQMAPKQMKIVQNTKDIIILKGFGKDQMDSSFEHYGIKIHLNEKDVEMITLQLLDRNTEMIYANAGTKKKKPGKEINIAKTLLNLLIEEHEDGDSLVRESDLKEKLKQLYSIDFSTNEISQSVNLINSQNNKNIIREGWISTGGSMLSESQETSYMTDSSKYYLKEIINSI